MGDHTPEAFGEFLSSPGIGTLFVEFRHRQELLAVAVADVLSTGLSAVYTFYEPTEARRGLGIFAVLWQIEEARRRGLGWLYLGYWIALCQKMSYKNRFQPYQIFRAGRWMGGGE
jgi:arginine-tRNA-protein transferase